MKNYISEALEELNKLEENLNIPEVGPFYIIEGIVYSDTEPDNEVDSNSLDNKDSNNNHYSYWEFLKKYFRFYDLEMYKLVKDKDYDYFPRGRVIYSVTNDTYNIFIDPCASENITDVIYELNLPKDKCHSITNDEHYKCHSCNENYSNESMNSNLYDENIQEILNYKKRNFK